MGEENVTFSYKRFLNLPKPTKEDFRGDRERVLDALNMPDASMTLEALRSLYPLTARADYAVTVTLCPGDRGTDVIRVEPGDTTHRLLGLALDIGSTTLEMELVDMLTGQVLRNVGCVNSQVSFGLNILDRILAVKENRENLEALRLLVTGDINRLIEEVTAGLAEPEEISALTVGGNTTMIHFFLGCDPWLVFQNPYAPVFFDPGIHSARELGLKLCCNVFCFPAKANYLGGDITAGLLLTDLDTGEKPSIFLDIGTNGELCLGCREFLLMGAGAAGPALEGFGSRYGMRAEPGAIRHMHIADDGSIQLDVIGGGEPVGICGTGIFDLVAQCYLRGIIFGDGTVNREQKGFTTEVWDETAERSVPAVVYYEKADKKLYFTEPDIREFIRCKAAAHTMVATLLEYCGLGLDDIDHIYLAGGFGTHIDLESAVTVGIYPDVDRKKMVLLGNTSLAGAKKLLLDAGQMARVRHFLESSEYLHFSEMERFPENMVAAEFIPHTDGRLYPSVKRHPLQK